MSKNGRPNSPKSSGQKSKVESRKSLKGEALVLTTQYYLYLVLPVNTLLMFLE